MAIQHQLTSRYLYNNGEKTVLGLLSTPATSNVEQEIVISVPAGAENYLAGVSVGASSLYMAFMTASGDVHVKTNSDTVPDQEFDLSLYLPLVWSSQMLARSLSFDTDLTALYFDNPGSLAVTVKLLVLESAIGIGFSLDTMSIVDLDSLSIEDLLLLPVVA